MLNDDLRLQGELAETTVPDLFRMLIRNGESGIVSLELSSCHDNIYFTDGRIVFASSSDPDLGLAELLLRSGELSIEQYDDAVEQSLGSKRLGTVLAEGGYLQPDELIRAIERQVVAIVQHSLEFRNGTYTIEFTSDFPREIVSLNLSTERLMLDGIRHIEKWSLIRRGIARMGRTLQHAASADTRLYHLDLTEEETHVYALFQEPATVETICQRSYMNNFQTCRTIWALVAANLLEDSEEGTTDRQRADVENELTLEGVVERYNSTLQSIFGIVFQEIGDSVYDFVDRVARNLSPETMPYLSGINLLNESRVDFDQLLNNLIASGSEDRLAVVSTVMNELLYAWMVEIKAEFGTKLDAKVMPLVNAIRT